MAMLFERFISKERNEPPDIDVDFEHERREGDQYIYAKYGRERAARRRRVICYTAAQRCATISRAALGLNLLRRSRRWRAACNGGMASASVRSACAPPTPIPTIRRIARVVHRWR